MGQWYTRHSSPVSLCFVAVTTGNQHIPGWGHTINFPFRENADYTVYRRFPFVHKRTRLFRKQRSSEQSQTSATGSNQAFDVVVESFGDHSHASLVAKRFSTKHPYLTWTGRWSNAVDELRVINVEWRQAATGSNPAFDVDIGTVRGRTHVISVAEDFILTHPNLRWTRHWKNINCAVSFIGMKLRSS